VKKIFFFLITALLLTFSASADEQAGGSVFREIAGDAVSFFAPLNGRVTSVGDGKASINIGKAEGVRVGMRLTVFREGGEFRHPVTGEVLGNIENEAGSVEITSVDEKNSTGKIIQGDIKENDMVRISQGILPVLFYQTKSVDWAAGDALFRALKNTGRFDLIETESDKDDPSVMLGEVKDNRAVFGVFLKQAKVTGEQNLYVSFYHPDGTEFYSRDIALTEEKIKELKFGYEFLKKVETKTRWSFKVPSSTEFVTACDVNGDGTDELVMVISDEIQVFRLGDELKLLYSGEIGNFGESLWLGCGDVTGDKDAEVIVTSWVSQTEVVSTVFGLNGDSLNALHSEKGFLRILKNRLYTQEYSPRDGYTGTVLELDPARDWAESKLLDLPPQANIYDFYPVATEKGQSVLVVDDSAHVDLYNDGGVMVWRSNETLGGFIREYDKKYQTQIGNFGNWYVKDRGLYYGNSILLIKRHPVSKMAPGLGFSSSDVIELSVSGDQVQESPVLKDIAGDILDFTVVGDKLVVLEKEPLGARAWGIFKGENPFKRNLYLFPLKED
jgi:hypothetical protein